jgi:hypothetical protein
MSMTDVADPLGRFEAFLESEEDEGEAEIESEAPDEGQAEDEIETEAEADDEAEAEEEESDDDDEGDDDDAEPDGPPSIKIDFDGESQRLTAEEIKAGFERHADYTRKTMALAEERKSFEAAAQQQVQYIRQQLAELQKFQEAEPDWAKMRDEDPIGYIQEKAKWDEKQASRQALLQQTEAERRQRYEQQIAQGREQLMAALPSWKDDAVRQKESAEITATLTSDYGFRQEELQGLADHRLVVLSRDAMKWRQLQKSKPAVTKKVADKPKVSKPGSATKVNPARTAATKARKAAQKTQSPRDWAAAFEDFV